MSINRRKFLKTSGLTITTFGLVPGMLGWSKTDTTQTLQKMTEGVIPLTREDYEGRLEKARTLMADHRMDGLLLTGGANLSYFLNMSWWRSERLFGAIINLKGDTIWICPAFELERAKEVIQFGTDIRTWEEHESPYELVKAIMKDLGTLATKLGIGPTVRNFVVEGIRKTIQGSNIQMVDGSVITTGCRGIKTEKELAYMDLANKITKMAYREAFKKLQEGMSRRELRNHIQQAHSEMGVSGGGSPQFGHISAFPHGSREVHKLHEGDIVLVDGGTSVEGYRSDVTRTIVFGKPSDKQKRVFDIVLKAQTEAMKAVRPGKTCESIDAVARKVIEDAGFGPGYEYFAHRLGHGIGMEGHEYPYLVKGNKLKLKPGMTFSNEPGIYIYGEFGVRIEDCFVVTEDGGKILGGMITGAIGLPFG
ncbi:Xaa-Pro dipeptidase [subsurface metagenome]